MKALLLFALAALALNSCTAITGFLASPLGQASLVTAETLGKQLAKAAEKQVLEEIIIKAVTTIRALTAQGINPDLSKEILRKAQIAGLQSVYDAAQVQYAAQTGARFIIPAAPKNPIPITP